MAMSQHERVLKDELAKVHDAHREAEVRLEEARRARDTASEHIVWLESMIEEGNRRRNDSSDADATA